MRNLIRKIFKKSSNKQIKGGWMQHFKFGIDERVLYIGRYSIRTGYVSKIEMIIGHSRKSTIVYHIREELQYKEYKEELINLYEDKIYTTEEEIIEAIINKRQ